MSEADEVEYVSAPERISPAWIRRLRSVPAVAIGDAEQDWESEPLFQAGGEAAVPSGRQL